MIRRWIYRDDAPAAWRLALADDRTFTFVQSVYAGDDGFENVASGRWEQRATDFVLTATESDCGLLPVGEEAPLRSEGVAVWLRGSRLDPDLPMRYVSAEEKELWTLDHQLTLDRDGRFTLVRIAAGAAGNGETRQAGTWTLTADAVELQPEDELAVKLARLDGDALDLAGSRLEPVD